MSSTLSRRMLGVLALAAAQAAAAQIVQRCEDAAGKVTYSNESCPAGTRAVREFKAPEAPPETDRKAARERAARDAKAAQAAEKRKREDEEKAERERAAQRKDAEKKAQEQARECRKLEQRLRAARQDVERAPLNKREAAERKLRSAQDAYELDCGPS